MDNQVAQIAKSYVEATKKVLNGEMTLEQLRTYWRIEVDREELLWRLMSETEHFLVDVDIRSKDLKYEQYQRDLLADLIDEVTKQYSAEEGPIA